MMTCLNNILVFLQLAVNGETDNIFLMVSLRACATAANKHKFCEKFETLLLHTDAQFKSHHESATRR